MTERSQTPDLHEVRDAHVEDALRSGGVLREVAAKLVVNGHEIVSPGDAADLVLPPRQPGEVYMARWEHIADAKQVKTSTLEEVQTQVYDLAETLDMRRAESLAEADIQRITRDSAIFMIEGGANRTSVVRRTLAIETISQLYGSDTPSRVIYQFGSDRPIPKFKKDKDGNDVENPEYKVAKEIAGDHLPEGDSLTEYGLNVASALQEDYKITKDLGGDEDDPVEWGKMMKKDGSPYLLIIQPKTVEGGLVDGINAVYDIHYHQDPSKIFGDTPSQPVIFTNGQYRPKDELQASQWALKIGYDILPPVAIGDEPGYTVSHNGKEIVTAKRAPVIYAHEMVVLHRLNS